MNALYTHCQSGGKGWWYSATQRNNHRAKTSTESDIGFHVMFYREGGEFISLPKFNKDLLERLDLDEFVE